MCLDLKMNRTLCKMENKTFRNMCWIYYYLWFVFNVWIAVLSAGFLIGAYFMYKVVDKDNERWKEIVYMVYDAPLVPLPFKGRV